MSACPCPDASLTSLRFADGLVMQRCAVHEQQSWFVDGRPAERHEVMPALRHLFVDRRGERSATRGAARARPLHHQPAAPEEPVAHEVRGPQADDGERLTALLRARGLSGTWAVA